MREITFRGKRIDNGKFIEGDLINLDNYTLIATKDMWASNLQDNYSTTKTLELEVLPVIKESVGQFTGLTDKNGIKVFEGDILEVAYYNYNFKNTKLIQEVYYLEQLGCFCAKTVGKTVDPIEYYRNNVPLSWTNKPNSIEVIGNIHDKPRIIKVT